MPDLIPATDLWLFFIADQYAGFLPTHLHWPGKQLATVGSWWDRGGIVVASWWHRGV